MTTTASDLLSADPKFDAAVLAPWRSAGRTLVADHWAEFQNLIEPIEVLIARQRYAEAAAAAQVAANYAVFWHPGLFASSAIEGALRKLGEAALPQPGTTGGVPGKHRDLRVLHVASQVGAIGGHSRMLWRWINQDTENVHSVALTRQHQPVPSTIDSAVARSGGQVRSMNRGIGGLLSWARRLQALLSEANLVVLHADNMDVIPILALAGMKQRPSVILLNHADHLFWLGADFVDLVVSTRRSGLDLCIARRGISKQRNALLPLCMEPAPRRLSRPSAKQALGLSADSVVVLSVARSQKFRTIAGVSFADAFVPVLRKDPRIHLVAVGPGGAVDWSDAEGAVPGQIHVFSESPNTNVFLEAADIYVDSFPFASITSMFEAGLHDLPLVTLSPFGPNCQVMAADSPGLDKVIIRARGVEQLQGSIQHLAADPEVRAEIGRRTRAEIETVNMGKEWERALLSVYERVFNLPRRRRARTQIDENPMFDDLDLFSPFLFGDPHEGATPAARLAIATERALRAGPMGWRLRRLAGMVLRRQLGGRSKQTSWRYLVPEWLGCRLRMLIPRRT